jgi:hypothetical protein
LPEDDIYTVTNQLKTVSIKSLYPLALAEGEGVGTAYEYFAKRLALRKWLPALTASGDILIAGLPEKYGASLDFLLLAEQLGRGVVIVDERPNALEKVKGALAAAQEIGLLRSVKPSYLQVADLSKMIELPGRFGFCISSEVLQRIPAMDRTDYWQQLMELAPAAAVFAPNADNPAHTNLSGLAGLHLDELREIVGTAAATNYIDMPPFPPGMTRTGEQREQAESGRMEAIAMWGLGWYARLERFLPKQIRRTQAHIVFALSG